MNNDSSRTSLLLVFTLSHTDVSLSNIPMVWRSQNRLILLFKQLACLQTIFITCGGFFGLELFVLVSTTNVQLLPRFISPVKNSQYVLDPINKSILVLSEWPWFLNALETASFAKTHISQKHIFFFFMSVYIFGIPNSVISFLSPVRSDLRTALYSSSFRFDSLVFKNALTNSRCLT